MHAYMHFCTYTYIHARTHTYAQTAMVEREMEVVKGQLDTAKGQVQETIDELESCNALLAEARLKERQFAGE
jgi:hypothetical protein